MNPRDGGFPKRLKLYILSLKLTGFAGSGVKIRFNLPGGISTQGPKIVIYSCACGTFLFYSFGPGMKIRMNPRDGGFPKRLKLYISNLKRACFAGFGVKISFNLRSGISTQGPKIVISSGRCSTLLFDSFGPEVKIRMKDNTRYIGFPKRPKLYISILKISFNLRSGIN